MNGIAECIPYKRGHRQASVRHAEEVPRRLILALI